MLALLLAGALAALPNEPVLTIVSVHPVELDEPASFWRDGSELHSRNALLLRVHVRDMFQFVPRDLSDPLFMLGETVCVVVRSPLGGDALVLAPQDPSVELWVTPPGELPSILSGRAGPAHATRELPRPQGARDGRACTRCECPARAGPVAAVRALGGAPQGVTWTG